MTASRTAGLWLGATGLLAIILAAAVWSQAGVTRAQTPTPAVASRTITVNGTGTATARPDEAIVSLGTQVQAPTAAEAQAQNAQQINAVIEAMKNLGIPAANIQTTNISLFPIMRDQPEPRPGASTTNQQPAIEGYRASATLRIKVTAVDQAGDVIDAAVVAGANQIQGIQFSLSDDAALRGQALQEAVGDARRHADAIAQVLGVQITGVEAVIESGAVAPPRPLAAPMAADARSAGQAQIEPGEQTVTAQVSVTYSY